MNIFTNFSTKLIILTFASLLLLAGCDNPASNDDDHEEHSEPHSIEFVMNGETIVTYDGEVSGHFHVEEQDDTSLITAEFFDEDGNEIHGDDLDDEYSLAWEIANTDHADIEQHDEDGRWSFHIAGNNAGETAIQFSLMHVDHSVFDTPAVGESNAIQIHVEEPSN